jgi:hypothetical protein
MPAGAPAGRVSAAFALAGAGAADVAVDDTAEVKCSATLAPFSADVLKRELR